MSKDEQEAMVAQAMEQQRQAKAAADEPALPAPTADAKPGFDDAVPATWGNPGRNDLCPCGSGNKFKHCHGRLT
jgi:preprotein translocase subunit SecA